MGPRSAGDLTHSVIRHEVTGVQFGVYTDSETKERSVAQVTSPVAFDSLNNPLPSGVYDPRLGPTDNRAGVCVTCHCPFLNCPGHFGHIELCVPIYHPLLFPRLVSLLRLKCLNCHQFRISKRECRVFQAKQHLISSGRVKDALELDDTLEQAKRHAGELLPPDGGSGVGSKRNELEMAAAASSIDDILDRISADPIPPGVKLTSHERSVRRQIIKEFQANCSATRKCANCSAISPKIRQDSANKIFQCALSKKDARANAAERIKFISAIEVEKFGVATSYDSDDSNLGDNSEGFDDNSHGVEDDDESGENNHGYNTGIADLFDEEAKEGGEGGDEDLGYKKREAVVERKGANKGGGDKYLHPLEVEAQAKLVWELQPDICGMVFGSAHCEKSDGGRGGYSLFFMRNVAVPPSKFRPPMVLGTMTVEHAQNVYLNKVIELNDRVRSYMAMVLGVPEQLSGKKESEKVKILAEKEKAESRAFSSWINLQTQVNCFMDSSKDPSAAATENLPPGIRQLLEKKEGIFRKHMMGKRVNFACRSVISPDPYIGTNEIGLPFYFAKTLTYPTPVTERNVEEMRELVTRGPHNYPGAVWVEFPDGRRVDLSKMSDVNRKAIASRLLPKVGLVTVGRQLKNGDMVLMNRQPTLHKPGIMAHSVRVLYSRTQNTLRMHYANCNTYNADFDGDEMNCHFPQNDIAKAEAEFILNTDLQYIVPTDGSPLRGLIQDHVDSGVKLTGKDTFIEKWEYQQLIFASLTSLSGLEIIQSNADIELLPPAICKPRELWTGKQVISTLLHHLRKGGDKFDLSETNLLPGLCMERKSKTPPSCFGAQQEEHLVLVRDGELLRGVLDKAAFGATDFSLVHAVYEAYGPNKAGLLLNAFGRLFTAYLQYYSGHSCRMEDLVLTKDADRERREVVQNSYNIGARAAKAWADSEGGKVPIHSVESLPKSTEPLKPVESAATAAKISSLLSGEEGKDNAAALDGFMQSQMNPLASKIIKTCLPGGLAVPFPANTFSLMTQTGAKGSMVNQSQVSCALGQQALEGRRVPRMSSGRTLPSFMPYDPNPRADGFISDRFLTGIRPQEYYFHCMAGREGLVDTAVKTSRSGYLQRCLVKHLEELKVCYDSTVRDGEGSVIQFLYGEDGIDPIKASHLDCKSRTFQFIARNHQSLGRRYVGLPSSSIDAASSDYSRSKEVLSSASNKTLLKVGAFVKARKLQIGHKWERGALCRGWFDALVTKVHSDKKHFDIKYVKDQTTSLRVPVQVKFSYAGGKNTPALSKICVIIKASAPDPILSGAAREGGNHKIGLSGSCVSEHVASAAAGALNSDEVLHSALKSAKLSKAAFGRLIAKKYGSALCAPGEAVGSIAAQSIGEPSTQMTLNTFHLAGAGANVTLGIPRLREIIMTASRELKTPTMSVPLHSSVSDKEAKKLTRYFTKLTLMELISEKDGISVTETLQQSGGGSWERAYHVRLTFHSKERISEAFGLDLEDIASVVAEKFIPKLSYHMKLEMRRSSGDDTSHAVAGGEKSTYIVERKDTRSVDDGEDVNASDEYDDEAGNEEDGVRGRFGHKEEMVSYGDADDEEKELVASTQEENIAASADALPTVSDDEGDISSKETNTSSLQGLSSVKIDYKTNSMILQPLRVDPSVRQLLMAGLAERAASGTQVRARPKINEAYINEEEGGRGRCLQTAGINFAEIWQLNQVDHNRLASNDIWAVRCAYGVEAARMNIVDQIKGVFAVYGIEVDPRHLSLIADYMTFDGGYKAMNRIGMADSSSPFLQMSFETTANFMVEAAIHGASEPMQSPSANIVVGRPIRHGTGAFECFAKV